MVSEISSRLILPLLLACMGQPHLWSQEKPKSQLDELPAERMSFLDNGVIRLSVDLNRGGAITFLARKGGGNVINNYDLGRQVQLSFFSGPVPFVVGDQHPSEHWAHIGWNPIQAGDDFHHGSPVVDFSNDGQHLHVKCIPLQWPLNNIPGECTYETWLELDGSVVKAHAHLNNARTDRTQYPARLQELPAVYGNAPFHRVVSYTGARPFTQDAVTDLPKSLTTHPWTARQATENWSALVNDAGEGLGVITPGHIDFTGGFVGRPGPNDTHATSTGYLAGQEQEILDYNITYNYRFELMLGTLDEIRARAAAQRRQGLPSWTFAQDRQSWHFINAHDTGWPIHGDLNVIAGEPHPHLISPYVFWQAEEAPVLVLEAAFHTHEAKARVFWWCHGDNSFGAKDYLDFPIQNDGANHRYTIRLADSPNYRGAIIRLRLDFQPDGVPQGDWIKFHSIHLQAEAQTEKAGP